jgi:hypothetical protein
MEAREVANAGQRAEQVAVAREQLPPLQLVLSGGEAGGARLVLVGVEATRRLSGRMGAGFTITAP